ncbi:MAG: GntR family transcriptional regulator [Thermodesulfobacteriota bacterium]
MKRKGEAVERVYLEIKNMIHYNLLAPGQKIIYQDLAERLQVSVTPIVQALKRLERSNLVIYKANKGYFVGELTEQIIEELYQVREGLETYIVPLVLNNLGVEALRSIRAAFKEYDGAAKSFPEGRRLMLSDAQFHLKIIEHSGNRAVYDILKDVFEQIYLRYKPEYLLKERVKEAYKEHRAILKSLEQSDVEAVKALISYHIQNGKKHILHMIRMQNIMFIQKRHSDELVGSSALAVSSDGKTPPETSRQ